MRKISKEGLKIIKRWEGLHLHAYQDPVGLWTIGYGHTDQLGEPPVQEGMQITVADAETLLQKDLAQFEKTVEEMVVQSLNDEQFAALVSFCYNVGIEAFCNSTLLRKLNKGDFEAVPAELQKWTKVEGKRLQGLVHRRAAEAGLWAKGAYVSSNYQQVQTPRKPVWGNVELLAPIISSFSGLTGILTGQGPVQWAFALVMVLATIAAIGMSVYRMREEYP
ncbi:lysozyme [Bartonella senegalensis]|uniref:lysozyme n=1 Tax=Bartonella senegalensis TaxID=1468418 RepID=UPI0002FF3CBF|nr:lysozyme [Bartonella senegalensis]